jgi:hypothetical protein
MKAELIFEPAQTPEAVQELRVCNAFSETYGLRLTESEIQELLAERVRILAATGRVEFEGGILPRLIHAFCDSPYVEPDIWEQTLAELQEMFYYFKSESGDRLTDDELLDFMVRIFNGRAQGSTEYLSGTSLEELIRTEDMEPETWENGEGL